MKRCTLPVLFVFCSMATVAVSVSTAADWPRFRGPGGLGVSDSANLPVEWDAQKNVRWKTDLPGFGASSPIVVGDRIFVTCYSGYGASGGPVAKKGKKD